MASQESSEVKANPTAKRMLKTSITKKMASKKNLEAEVKAEAKVDTRDDYVTSQWKSQPAVCEFLIRNAYVAMTSARADIIFEPFPASWKDNLDTSASYDISKIIKKQCIITDIEIVISCLLDSYNDAEVLERLNSQTYELVRFILQSNKVLIKADNLLSADDVIYYNPSTSSGKKHANVVGSVDGSEKEKVALDLKSINLIQFKVEHTQLVEDSFKCHDTIDLYHGSRSENWHSIMCNGLKSGSKSKYFLHGAAYGNGIYLSNDIRMSLGYSTGVGLISTLHRNASSSTNSSNILAIFEVINNPKWHKGGSVYVVDDENALILRYLLVFNDSTNPVIQGVFNAINKKLNTGGIKVAEQQKKEMEVKNITVIRNKRLMKEYQAIMKQSPEALGFNIQLAEEDNLSRWMVYLTRPENPQLELQMSRLGIPAIEIEITFKENYPIAPPFIRVVFPHFKFHSGHITVGGSLCMEMLTNQGWSPTFNVENVITQIKMAISDGGGEIDERNYRNRYTMEEALDAFKRVLASHGWV
jgi:ubiquitin-protein ligase